MLQTSEQRRCAGQGSGGEYCRSSCQPCVCSHGTKPPRSQPCCCKRGGRAEQVREGLSPQEAELLLWELSDRLRSVAMHMFFFSVLKSHWESIITPLRPCNFMAFFIMAIIYNNLAVMLASSLASVVSDSPSKMMEVKLDHFIRAKSSFLLSFLLPKWWLCQWYSSGLFFRCTHPQRHTVSGFPFLRVRLNTTPWQSSLLSAAEIVEDSVLLVFPILHALLIPILYQKLKFLHGSHLLLSYWAWPVLLKMAIQHLEGCKARGVLEGLLEERDTFGIPEIMQKQQWPCTGAW